MCHAMRHIASLSSVFFLCQWWTCKFLMQSFLSVNGKCMLSPLLGEEFFKDKKWQHPCPWSHTTVSHFARIFFMQPRKNSLNQLTTSIPAQSTRMVFVGLDWLKSHLNLFSHTNHRVNSKFAPALSDYFEFISKPFCCGQLQQPIQESNHGWPNI